MTSVPLYGGSLLEFFVKSVELTGWKEAGRRSSLSSAFQSRIPRMVATIIGLTGCIDEHQRSTLRVLRADAGKRSGPTALRFTNHHSVHQLVTEYHFRSQDGWAQWSPGRGFDRQPPNGPASWLSSLIEGQPAVCRLPIVLVVGGCWLLPTTFLWSSTS
ncbi:hypothetical protein ASPZODRAFT_571420 [Penicilliopsis zonata CBS 506.65]|uniref:Uncharacterized protein n=1 Tax=Penicilliopsis zonata CBS 506.65 TaxID=1073090 RepID=A0A1L9SDR4_9EURO|nr:hypothetical protein ASPZODRAFT_571420 [Penicilliopsis zonata CBS 506.65]OJJ45321.1 hypothetical protein ASPZODRAFT_571420 [Penicilliopsis zonata CBS 506.65]